MDRLGASSGMLGGKAGWSWLGGTARSSGRRRCALIVRAVKAARKIAEELGISHFALRHWVKRSELTPEAGSESKEVKRLR